MHSTIRSQSEWQPSLRPALSTVHRVAVRDSLAAAPFVRLPDGSARPAGPRLAEGGRRRANIVALVGGVIINTRREEQKASSAIGEPTDPSVKIITSCRG